MSGNERDALAYPIAGGHQFAVRQRLVEAQNHEIRGIAGQRKSLPLEFFFQLGSTQQKDSRAFLEGVDIEGGRLSRGQYVSGVAVDSQLRQLVRVVFGVTRRVVGHKQEVAPSLAKVLYEIESPRQ